MGIKRLQHAVDGRFDQIALIDLFDILRANTLENVAEQVQLFIDRCCALVFLCDQGAGNLQGQQRARQSATDCCNHKFFHSQLSFVAANHGAGSVGVVPSLISI